MTKEQSVRTRRRNRLTRVTALVGAGVLSLGLAACGGGNDSANSAPSAAAASPVAAINPLTGVKTQVMVEPGFLQALSGFGVTPGVIGSATLDGTTLTFPITGGQATYYRPGTRDPYVTGSIFHSGSGLSLTAAGKTIMLEDFIVDPGTSMLFGRVSVNGQQAADRAPLFFLDGRTLQPLMVNGNTAVLEGTTVFLTQQAADLINMVYGLQNAQVKVIPTKVGIAKITLALPSS